MVHPPSQKAISTGDRGNSSSGGGGAPTQHHTKTLRRLAPTSNSQSDGTTLGATGRGFIGFGAFANVKTTAPTASANITTDGDPITASPTSSSGGTNTFTTAQPESSKTTIINDANRPPTVTTAVLVGIPVYTGPDETLRKILARIHQKREAVTVQKALQELHDYLLGTNESNHGDSSLDSVSPLPPPLQSLPHKRIVAEAMQHYAWLYHVQLAWSDAAIIRAGALRVWLALANRVPKALFNFIHVDSTKTPTASRAGRELLGLWYAAQCDSAREVRAVAASATAHALYDHVDWPWHEGVLALSARILQHDRAESLYQAIRQPHLAAAAPKRTVGTGSADRPKSSRKTVDPIATTTTTAATGDQALLEREMMQEFYVRVVGNCLEACRHWLQQRAATLNTTATQTMAPPETSHWWNMLLNINNVHKHYPSVRRQAYSLLGVIVTVEPHWIPAHRLFTALPAMISSEKEAANVPLLLETVLTMLVTKKTSDSDNHDPWKQLTSVVPAPLTKLLQKACYGAKVETWGPILLPLVAVPWSEGNSSSPLAVPLQLLQGAALGVSRTLGSADAYHLWAAIAESVFFVLVRSKPTDTTSVTTTTELATPPVTVTNDSVASPMVQLWLDAWQFLLTPVTSSRGGAVATTAQTRLLQELARQLVQFDAASQRATSMFCDVADWFWNHGFVLASDAHYNAEALSQFLSELNSRVGRGSTERSRLVEHLRPELQQCFAQTLKQYQTSSSLVPSLDVYHLWRTMFEFCGAESIFAAPIQGANHSDLDAQATATRPLESFVMNDLLRWTVIHTSMLPTAQGHEQSFALVDMDFSLLWHCLSVMLTNGQRTRTLWSAFLREVIAAKCDIGFLSAGLATLVRETLSAGAANFEWICCDTLDTFATSVVTASTEPLDQGDFLDANDAGAADTVHGQTPTTGRLRKRLEFYRTCLGLNSSSVDSAMIVSGDVAKEWIDYACRIEWSTNLEHKSGNLLLEVLLQTIQQQRHGGLLNDDACRDVFVAAWHVPDPLFETYAYDILEANLTLRARVESSASRILAGQVADCLAQDDSDCSPEFARSWGLRAWRIYQLVKNDTTTRIVSLGIEDLALWQKNPPVLFRLSMALLRRIPTENERFELIASWNRSDSARLLVDILLTLSEASADYLESQRSRNRSDQSAELLGALGAKSLEKTEIERMIRGLIEGFATAQEPGLVDDAYLRKRVSVLSQLLELRFAPPQFADPFLLAVDEVREGDRIMYITDPELPESKEEAEVLKVHFDAQAGYFYSIRVERDGNHQERQTVIERLRRKQDYDSDVRPTLYSSLPDEECSTRTSIRDAIWNRILSQNSSVTTSVPSLCELVHVVTSQIGLGKARGIGSSHYDIHRFVTALEHRIDISSDMDATVTGKNLWCLALALGLGLNTPGASPSSTVDRLRFDALPLTEKLTVYYKDCSIGEDHDLDCGAMAFLVVAGFGLGQYPPMPSHPLVLLFELATQVLKRVEEGKLTGGAAIACRALYEGVQRPFPATMDKSTITVTQENAFSSLIAVFSLHFPSTSFVQLTFLPQLVRQALHDETLRTSLADAAGSSNLKALCKSLFDPEKRYVAFLLLDFLARRKMPLQQNDQVAIATSTKYRLKSWIDGMEEEEAAIVEEDVFIVAEWVPPDIMDEIENWEDAGYEMEDEAVIVGRLLTWFCFLRFVDASTPVDFRNRPAFVSYLEKCGAANSILNLGVLHNEIINDQKRNATPKLLEAGDLLLGECFRDVTQLATLSLFRTVEVLPSLSRRWWEDDCPKVYTSAVQLLVERYVAPAILRRELERIKQATTFGLMKVTASQTSREITATYEQDDFVLKVSITLPSAFPFRNAEVDCTKTLGIPQKRQKHWSLQITQMLNSQGGTLQDALMLWKDNVDKEFEGLEPCPVCYSVLSVKTHKLPCLECKICHNRFHLDCLSQWFRSSGKSQCVLCQSPWQGTRVQ
jgi:hypothetical protein